MWLLSPINEQTAGLIPIAPFDANARVARLYSLKPLPLQTVCARPASHSGTRMLKIATSRSKARNV